VSLPTLFAILLMLARYEDVNNREQLQNHEENSSDSCLSNVLLKNLRIIKNIHITGKEVTAI